MKIADQIVSLMLTGTPGEVWTSRQLGAALEVPRADLTDALNSLRYAGKLDWSKLKLAPSMWIGRNEQDGAAGTVSPESAAPVGEVAPIASPALLQAAAEETVAAPAEVAGEAMVAPATEAEPVVAVPSLAEQVHAEAVTAGNQRREARSVSATSRGRVGMPLRERIDREFLAEPVDALTLLRRRWPDLLDELVAVARRRQQPVAEAVRDVIEGGLERLAVEGFKQ